MNVLFFLRHPVTVFCHTFPTSNDIKNLVKLENTSINSINTKEHHINYRNPRYHIQECLV